MTPGTLAVVRRRLDGSSALLAWAEGKDEITVIGSGTVALVVCCGEDRFGREMRTVMAVQSLLVRVYNGDLEEVR